jgi:hypothetical protein
MIARGTAMMQMSTTTQRSAPRLLSRWLVSSVATMMPAMMHSA